MEIRILSSLTSGTRLVDTVRFGRRAEKERETVFGQYALARQHGHEIVPLVSDQFGALSTDALKVLTRMASEATDSIHEQEDLRTLTETNHTAAQSFTRFHLTRIVAATQREVARQVISGLYRAI